MQGLFDNGNNHKPEASTDHDAESIQYDYTVYTNNYRPRSELSTDRNQHQNPNDKLLILQPGFQPQ